MAIHPAKGALLLLVLLPACVRSFDGPQALPPSNPRFSRPVEKIVKGPAAVVVRLPAPGTYSYSSQYIDTGTDHAHNETYEVGQPEKLKGVDQVMTWWRQDREVPWFEMLQATEEGVRIKAFSLTEGRESTCYLDPPMIKYPASISVGTSWTTSSVCRNDPGFKRYMTSDMRVTRKESVTVATKTFDAYVIEGDLRIVRRSTTFTIGLERYFSVETGLVVKEIIKFADSSTGSGRLERSMV